jgi:hypothetical protein
VNERCRPLSCPREVQGRRSVLADRSAAFTVAGDFQSFLSAEIRQINRRAELATIFLLAGRRPGSPRRVRSHRAPLRRKPQNNQSDNPLSQVAPAAGAGLPATLSRGNGPAEYLARSWRIGQESRRRRFTPWTARSIAQRALNITFMRGRRH